MATDIFDLTPSQKKKFKAFKKAYNALLKENVLPVNIYSTLTFFNKEFIANYGDGDSGFDEELSISARESFTLNYVRVDHEWTDDHHTILLTPKGATIYNQNNTP